MTLHAVTVPKWGLAMEEGTLASWLVDEGATVAPGDEIAEVETSKIANVLEASAAGVLCRRVAAEGDVKAVGALLGVIADGSETDDAINAFVAEYESRFAGREIDDPTRTEPETVTVDGLPIRFLKVAADGYASGSPLVLIHGFGGDYRNWMFNQGALAADRDVYAIDLPGHGGSTKDVGDGSLDALAARIEGWSSGQGLGSVHLAGHSMGAAVAATLALAHPERVKSLTALCGAGFGGMLNRDYLAGFLAAPRRKELKPVVELLFADPDLVTREMLDDLVAYKRIDGVIEALRKLIDNALDDRQLVKLASRLGEIGAPRLALFGAADRVLPAPAGVERIEGTGHMPHLEAADAVNARIASFLASSD